MSVILPLSEQYRQRLRQASWRMQYRAKTRLYHENLSLNEQIDPFSVKSDEMNTIITQQWIDSLPWEKARHNRTCLFPWKAIDPLLCNNGIHFIGFYGKRVNLLI